MVLKTFISGFSPSLADPSWREQSFSRNGLPSRNGGVEVCFSTRGRESAARAGSHSTHSAVRCRRQQRRLKDHFLSASLPRPRKRTRRPPLPPLSYLEQSYLYPPCLWVVPLASPLSNFSPSPPSSLAPNLKRAAFSRNFLPFHSTPLLFRFGKCVVPLYNAPPAPQFRPLPLLLH